MYCKKCGEQIPDGSAFCPKCGADQEDDVKQHVKTPKKKLHKYTVIGIIMLVLGLIEDIGPTRTIPLFFFLVADVLFFFAYQKIDKETANFSMKINTVLLIAAVISTILEIVS